MGIAGRVRLGGRQPPSSSLSSGLATTATSATRPVSMMTRSISDAATFSTPTLSPTQALWSL